MEQRKKLSLLEMKGDLMTYFNWSANALVPFRPGAADSYLMKNRRTVLKVAQELLKLIHYEPVPLYRGIILKNPVTEVAPHKRLQYLSFSDDRSIAEHFADTNGFGSELINVTAQLGDYGYVIEYTPMVSEILFHHHFLSILPYAEAFSLLGMDGKSEVEGLKKQKEVTILQPPEPFANITPVSSCYKKVATPPDNREAPGPFNGRL